MMISRQVLGGILIFTLFLHIKRLTDQTAIPQAGWPLLDAHLILSELLCTCRGPLTHSYLETRKRVIANSADPDQTPQNVASDQGLQCLLIGFYINFRIKTTN